MPSKKGKTGGYKLNVPKRGKPGAKPPGYFGGGNLALVPDVSDEGQGEGTEDVHQAESASQAKEARVSQTLISGVGESGLVQQGESSRQSRDMVHKRFPVERQESNELREWVRLFRDSKGGAIPEAVVYRASMALARALTPEILARLSQSSLPPRPSTKDTQALARWEKHFIEIFLGPARMTG